MRLLLDTQAFIYLVNEPEALPPAARDAIEDAGNFRFLSIASPIELQIKVNTGKLSFGRSLRDLVQFELDRGAIQLLPITLDHIDALARLPDHHRDPFDRLLVAQAMHEKLVIVTADETIARYPVSVLWR